MKREALFGIAVAGVMLGVVTAAMTAGPSTPGEAPAGPPPLAVGAATGAVVQPAPLLPSEPGEPGEAPEPAPVVTPEIQAAVGTILSAHAQVHAADVKSAGSHLDEEFLKAITRTGDYIILRKPFHERVGPGALVSNGKLTDAGQALMDKLATVEDEALDPAIFGMPELQERVDAYLRRAKGAGVSLPSTAGRAGKVVLSLLKAPKLSAAEVAKRLAKVGEAPSAATVTAIAGQLLAARQSPRAQREEYALEVDLAKALLRYVLEYKVIERAGPFNLTLSEKRVTKFKRRRERIVNWMTEIVQAEDPANAMATLLTPPHPQYPAMVEAYKKYKQIAASKCWRELPETWKIKPGDKGDPVKLLQKRMACEGYYEGEADGHYGDALLKATMAYQAHHDLDEDGYIYKGTLRSMNVPIDQRVKQLELAVQRLRESDWDKLEGDFALRVNIPSFQLQAYEDGQLIRRHKVIVGTNKLDDDKVKLVQGHINRTDLFTTELYEIVINPDWILPTRIEKGEIKAALAKDPKYLEKHNIKKVELPSGRVALVQGRGELNVLGDVKFLLKKSRSIFLHDTNKRSMFKHRRRDFSHGCIRVHKAVDFAKWLLARDGKDPKEIRRTFKATNTQRGWGLDKPVPVITEYVTVDLDDEGQPIFYSDVYGYDKDYFEGDLPPALTSRWGAPTHRPHWVPRVDEDVVNAWRAAGKPAPRNYDPAKHGGG